MKENQRRSDSPCEQALSLLRDLVGIPSVNPACLEHSSSHPEDISGEEKISRWLMEWGEKNGIPCRSIETLPGRPCTLFEIPADVPGKNQPPLIACFAHSDTVWTPGICDPFSLRECGGKYYGLGAADDKASIVAGLLALLKLKNSPGRKASFTFVCTSDEESGFSGIKGLIPDLLKPDAVVVCEGTELDLVIAHKGLFRWDVTARGKAVHASLIPQGKNAIYAASRLMLSMEKLCGELIERNAHPLLGKPTLNVGLVKGGVQANSVPDLCSFTVERRLLPEENIAEAEREIRAALSTSGEDFELSPPYSDVEPFEIAPDHAWVSFVSARLKNVHPGFKIKGLQCATEAAQTGLHNIPTLVFGPGSLSVAHSIDEHVKPEEIVSASELLASLPFGDFPA